MKREGFRRVAAIFEQAIVLPEDERAGFVERACGGDDALRDEVASLLAQHRPAEPGPLEALAGLVADESGAPSPGAPDVIGQYTVRRIIATGGMGTVYEAVQDHPRRVVALKVLRHGLASPSSIRRFRHEAEFLGRLRHPHIARIYDAATQDEGAGARPWFAMEYVEGGRTLVEHARAERLGVRQRVALLAEVCDAVQHAHDQGIVHRDLKPDNILVDAHGEPRILDFGIARATDADLRLTTLETSAGVLVGTVPYMSPEQVTGVDEPDARSDVYALGVILYELLCGRLPYALQGKSIPEAARIIQQDEPTALGRLDRSLRGDLETVVARALEKDRARRYQSAAELAADLRHVLRDEPIDARPASTFYQLRKFTRRHPGLVGGLTASFVLLVAGIVGVTWQLQATREQVARFQELNAFVLSTFALLDPSGDAGVLDPPELGGRLPPAETLLLDAAARLETSFERWPETRADLHLRLARTFWGIGRFDDALHQYERAVAVRREYLGPEHVDTYVARLRMCEFRSLTGVPGPDQVEEATAIADGLERQGGELSDVWSARIVALNGRYNRGEAQEAIRGMRALLATIRARRPGDRMEYSLVRALSYACMFNGLQAEAEALLRPALERARRELDERDPHRRALPMRLAATLNDQRRYEEALPFAQEAYDLGRLPAVPALTLVDLRAGNHLATALIGLGRFDEGEAVLRERVEECREHLGRHPYTLWEVAALAWALEMQGKYQEAVDLLQASLRDDGLDEPDYHQCLVHTAIARSCEQLGRLAEAEDHWRLAAEDMERLGNVTTVPETRARLARLLERQGELAEAEREWRGCLAFVQEAGGADPRVVALARHDLAVFLTGHGGDGADGALEESAALAAEAAGQLAAIVGPAHAETVRARHAQALALQRLGRADEAERLLAVAIEDAVREHGDAHWTTCWLRSARGRCLTELGRFAEAEVELRAACDCRQATLEPGHALIDEARDDLVALYEAWGRPEQARQTREDADG